MDYLVDRAVPFDSSLVSAQTYDGVIVIPALAEEGIVQTLQSINSCSVPASLKVLILVVINDTTETSKEFVALNRHMNEFLKNYVMDHAQIDLKHIYASQLPAKKGGVGMARKIGMDQACHILKDQGEHQVVFSLDADCRVSENYIEEVFGFFQDHADIWCAHLFFEHPHQSADDPIIDYELHLRLYIGMLRSIGYPLAYQTVGSCLAVKKDAYMAMGGMNTRKAGEDFYFVHKFSGIRRMGEILTATVYPSGRVSDRVPFGTGRAIGQIEQGNIQTTYATGSYSDLKQLLQIVDNLYNDSTKENDLPPSIHQFLRAQKFQDALRDIRKNSSSPDSFVKRFYQWLNAFRVMKFLNFCELGFYPNETLEIVFNHLVGQQLTSVNCASNLNRLQVMRVLDRSGYDYISDPNAVINSG